MSINPEEIWEELINNKIEKLAATELLATLIETSDIDEIRIEAIEKLAKIIPSDYRFFKILESLIISDENVKVRSISIKYIGEFHLDKAFFLLNWAIKHEVDYNCQMDIINLLGKLNINETKLLLFDMIQKFIKKKYINKERKIETKKIKKVLKKLLKEKSYNVLTHNELAKILINIIIISHLLIKYYNVYYELNPENGLIKKLDLSDIEYEVKGMPWTWKNNIKSLSEISGIRHLNSLLYLDLSNNQIADIKEITYLQNLTHLILRNNRINSLENLKYIKIMANLEYIDLRGNEIVKKIRDNDFNPNLRVILWDS